jgi:hypothetical protein
MRGHVHRRGKTWSYVVDIGVHPTTGARPSTDQGWVRDPQGGRDRPCPGRRRHRRGRAEREPHAGRVLPPVARRALPDGQGHHRQELPGAPRLVRAATPGRRAQRSTGGSRQCAAPTGSRTSTDGSRRTRHSASARPSVYPSDAAAWTAWNSACFCSLRSCTAATIPRPPGCSDSAGCGSAKRAPRRRRRWFCSLAARVGWLGPTPVR